MTPYIRAANVKDGYLDLGDVKEMDFTPTERSGFGLRYGDVLVTEGSGSLAAIGAASVWKGQIPGVVCFQNHLIRIRAKGSMNAGFLAWWIRHAFGSGLFASLATGANIFNLGLENVAALRVGLPGMDEQSRIAAYLEDEVVAIEHLIAWKRRLVLALEERIDASLLTIINRSGLSGVGLSQGVPPLKRQLRKLDRAAHNDAPTVTAFRDGQVTARSLRRTDGFTESWTSRAKVQGVERGDVVIHGLDGYAGAIGTSESSGACSPAYHVTAPRVGGDADYYGRLLRLLAVTGYLGNFATSTRERAVDFRNWELLGRIPIPLIDLDEQAGVGDQIRALAPLRELEERSVRLLLERRQALITAAVTGRLEIPRVAA